MVNDLRLSTKNFTLDDQGEVGDFLGIQIQTLDDGSIVLTQPQLIDSIIQDLHLQSGSNHKNTPAITTKLLHKDADGPEMTPEFHYWSVIGKLNSTSLRNLRDRTSPSAYISSLDSQSTQKDAMPRW